MASKVQQLAASSFHADERMYESARPSFPAAVLKMVKEGIVVPLGNPTTVSSLSVLDLAAGTGKWTRLILPFGQLVAVEPSPGMRREFQLVCPDVDILDGSSTAIPLPDASVDVIFIAQSYVAVLSAEQKIELKKEVDRIMSAEDVHWDNGEGTEKVMQYPYTTDVGWFKKLS
uniref:Methyltransferase domain-containing protein n=1 Tax=Physcomitrium patens TaxID=3218 RepID=A0A7I4E576_PHYPA